MTRYAAPGRPGSVVAYRERYDHFIGGEYVAPAKGHYFANSTPVTGETFTEVARGTAEDVDRALDAAHGASRAWGRTSAAERATVLDEIADRVEDNLEALAVAESWDNGKPVRETLGADLPLAVDHFRCFAGLVRAQEGGLSRIADELVAHHFPEPLGVVGQLVPWNFPLLAAAWKLAPALAAGNAVVLKPAEQTPASVHVLVDVLADLLPPGVLNVVNGFGAEAGRSLVTSRRVARIAFTGERAAGLLVAQYAGENAVPVTLELGGTSVSVVFDDVTAARDAFFDKAVEGCATFVLNQGQMSTSPSRALVRSGARTEFLGAVVERVEAVVQGHPLDTATTIGALVDHDRVARVLAHVETGRREGARLLTGGERADLGGELSGGCYVAPTVLEGDTATGIFQDEVLGPVLTVTTFEDFADAIKTANGVPHLVGAGVWSRDGRTAHRAGREIQAGRVWVNDYQAHPGHAAFGGHEQSGFGRENRRTALGQYQQTKSLLVSHSPHAAGLL
ncbi:aldehyde dehydrogenase family protein [Umezawaea beigongshangensis]|uniref:aldehyde dehydrogenase family protein n=1 Tax=Umezawaea beigongshangensis TaxID=2780383 RepID=UPI0018F1D057|nr:aldehyde dehydrogenase family protein [Umezawaea beigongshangensis]